MREAMEIFFDKGFAKNMDSNPYLLCFSNGVFDFKAKEFRQGYPQDYITKTTGIAYQSLDALTRTHKETIDAINVFMKQLFPLPNVCKYMWDHLAATLIGIKKEHTFNIYRGSGSNGKSMLTELMSRCLGDYKGTVPITLVTEKRNAIGGTSSEVIQLKGVRYAVMQEPTVGAVINEGILKELTGGDPIQARALYSESEIFTPQFSLVVCTNALFNIKSNDDGTWRRMKLVDFISKFIVPGENHTDDTPYIFDKDRNLLEKIPEWAPVFISMLVKIACETDGVVNDTPEIVAASNKYRISQDCIGGFINDRLVKCEGETIGTKVLNNEFKTWFQINYGNRRPPRLSDLEEIMAKRFGSKSGSKWIGLKIRQDDEDDNVSENAQKL
jgi:P4 family phage/plasmid primase-like protien